MTTFSLSESQFLQLAQQGYNRIPLCLELSADLDTPLSIYLKLNSTKEQGSSGSFLLESVLGGERFGRYSFIGLPPQRWISADNGIVQLWEKDTNASTTSLGLSARLIERQETNPLDYIAAYLRQFRIAPQAGMPRFCGGLAGYLGYDCIRYIEPKLRNSSPAAGLPIPDLLLLQTETFAVVDNLKGTLQLWTCAPNDGARAYQNACASLLDLKARLAHPLPTLPTDSPPLSTVERPFAKADYLAAVEQALDHIKRGDAMQIVLSQRLEQPFSGSPLSLYRAMRRINPSPYMYFYDLGDVHIVGASPEVLVRQERNGNKRQVVIRPIAGTRRRGANAAEDAALEADLLSDAKERAEHLMLIDLARNDIGRIAKIGSVRVTEAFAIERYSHVIHIVSNVEGEVRDDVSNIDVLKASFPAGTLSGAPKVRAMEIIDELEPVKRNVYGGAVGYFSFNDEMDLAIAIRTAVIHRQTLYVQAGAGLVADSNPEAEWQETENKARSVLSAVELVSRGM